MPRAQILLVEYIGDPDPHGEYLMKPMRPGEFMATVERRLGAV